MAKKPRPSEGRGRITWTDQWDQEYVDEEVEGFIEFEPKGLGSSIVAGDDIASYDPEQDADLDEYWKADPHSWEMD